MVTGESCGRSSVHWHVVAEGLFIAVIGLIPAGWNFNPCLHPWGGCWSRGGFGVNCCWFLWGWLNCGSMTTSVVFHFEETDLAQMQTVIFFCLSGCRDVRGGDQAFWRPWVSTAGTRESSGWGERDSDSTHSQRDCRIPAEHRLTEGAFPEHAFISLLVPSRHPGKFLLVSSLWIRANVHSKDFIG